MHNNNNNNNNNNSSRLETPLLQDGLLSLHNRKLGAQEITTLELALFERASVQTNSLKSFLVVVILDFPTSIAGFDDHETSHRGGAWYNERVLFQNLRLANGF